MICFCYAAWLKHFSKDVWSLPLWEKLDFVFWNLNPTWSECPPPLQVRPDRCLVNDCHITLSNVTLSGPRVSGCHSLSVCHYARWTHMCIQIKWTWPENRNPLCCAKQQLDNEIQAATHGSLEVCCVNSSWLDSSLLFLSMVIHAGIYCRDDVQIFSDKMQRGPMSLFAKSLVSSVCCASVFLLNPVNDPP